MENIAQIRPNPNAIAPPRASDADQVGVPGAPQPGGGPGNVQGAPDAPQPGVGPGNVQGAPDAPQQGGVQAPGGVVPQPVGGNVQPVVPPAISSDQYLAHCSNGAKLLCGQYAIRALPANQQLMPDQAQLTAKGTAAKQALGLHDNASQRYAGVVDAILKKIEHNPKPTQEQVEDCLERFLQTDVLARSIAFKSHLFSINSGYIGNCYDPVNQRFVLIGDAIRDGKFPLSEELIDGLCNDLAENVATFIKANIKDVPAPGNGVEVLENMAPHEILLAMEKMEYKVDSAVDMLKLANQAIVKLAYSAREDKQVHELARELSGLLNRSVMWSADDTDDSAMKKLAILKRRLKSWDSQGLVSRLVRDAERPGANHLTREQGQFANEVKTLLDELSDQMIVTARMSLRSKFISATADKFRNVYEKGGSETCTISIKVGPELALLNDVLKIDFDIVDYEYSYSVNVAQPFGRIIAKSAYHIGADIHASLGGEKAPIKENASIAPQFRHAKDKIFQTPEELAESEIDCFMKRIRHYVQPLTIPRSTDTAVTKNSIKGFFHNIGSFFKSIGYGIKSLCKRLSEGSDKFVARKAMRENAAFCQHLVSKGIFGMYDTLGSISFNRKKGTEVKSYGFGITGKAGVKTPKFATLSTINGGDFGIGYQRLRTICNSSTLVLNSLGYDRHALESYLEQEYGKYTPQHITDTLQREKNEHALFVAKQQIVQPNPNGGAAPTQEKLLLTRIMELSGELDWFVNETNHDDLSKKTFKLHSPRSNERRALMDSRLAENRGQYMRCLMTRCAALRLMYLNIQEAGGANAQQLEACKQQLDMLSSRLCDPPIRLSKKNVESLYITQSVVTSKTTTTINSDVKLSLVPLGLQGVTTALKNGKAEDRTLAFKAQWDYPNVDKGLYANRASVTLSFSINADSLLRGGIHVLNDIIAVAVNKAVAEQAENAPGSGRFALEVTKDLIADAANDAMAYFTNQQVDGLLTETSNFSLNVKFFKTDTAIHLRYGGLTVMEDRSLTVGYDGTPGKLPIGSGIGLHVDASLSGSKQSCVVDKLGTGTFSRAIEDIREIQNMPAAFATYARGHFEALQKMQDNVLLDNKTLNNEFRSVLGKIGEFLRELKGEVERVAPPVSTKRLLEIRTMMKAAYNLTKAIACIRAPVNVQHQTNIAIANMKTEMRDLQCAIYAKDGIANPAGLHAQYDLDFPEPPFVPVAQGNSLVSPILNLCKALNAVDSQIIAMTGRNAPRGA